MHAGINVRFDISIDEDKTLLLATLAAAITDLNLEATILEETLGVEFVIDPSVVDIIVRRGDAY